MRAASLRTFPVAVSLNELAWLALFVAVIWFDHATRQYQTSLAQLQGEHAELEAKAAAAHADEVHVRAGLSVNQELVGVHGNLRSVVFVIDRSGSMNRDGRWQATRGVIKAWLEYLPIERAAMVAFNDSVDTFPAAGRFWEVTGPSARENRVELLGSFDQLTPSGNTNTLAALEAAYAFPGVDSIFLFSDGEPDSGGNAFDRRMAKRVHELCRRHGTAVPVNTVGLGDYLEDHNLGWFLETIARETGGTFLGR